ncbi:hypothetical protein VCHENC02_3651B, partial [Vibrio harveyi]
IRTSFFQA